jgi:hypothetical protein
VLTKRPFTQHQKLMVTWSNSDGKIFKKQQVIRNKLLQARVADVVIIVELDEFQLSKPFALVQVSSGILKVVRTNDKAEKKDRTDLHDETEDT